MAASRLSCQCLFSLVLNTVLTSTDTTGATQCFPEDFNVTPTSIQIQEFIFSIHETLYTSVTVAVIQPCPL